MTNLLFRCISLPAQNFICKTRNPTSTSRYFSTNNNNNNNNNNATDINIIKGIKGDVKNQP